MLNLGESHPETGLSYYRARYYDPLPGRFLSEDPIRSPLHTNRYKYVRNSPPNRIDTSGMTDYHPHLGFTPRRGCTLVATVALTIWTSESDRTPLGDWYPTGSVQIGPDLDLGIPAASITCLWERKYTAELWGHVLTTYKYKCFSDDCLFGGHHEWTDVRFTWSLKDLGPTTGKEPTTTHHWALGAEDETNDVLCAIDKDYRPRQ
jgi:RHS repeat-associated protein